MKRAICTRVICTCPEGAACDHAVTLPQDQADELTVREILADLERDIGAALGVPFTMLGNPEPMGAGAALECAISANEVKPDGR